jgi:hypothetical protein
MAMAMAINSTAQAMENMEYVRSLLEQRQPEFAAALEWAAMQCAPGPASSLSWVASHRRILSLTYYSAEGGDRSEAAVPALPTRRASGYRQRYDRARQRRQRGPRRRRGAGT